MCSAPRKEMQRIHQATPVTYIRKISCQWLCIKLHSDLLVTQLQSCLYFAVLRTVHVWWWKDAGQYAVCGHVLRFEWQAVNPILCSTYFATVSTLLPHSLLLKAEHEGFRQITPLLTLDLKNLSEFISSSSASEMTSIMLPRQLIMRVSSERHLLRLAGTCQYEANSAAPGLSTGPSWHDWSRMGTNGYDV